MKPLESPLQCTENHPFRKSDSVSEKKHSFRRISDAFCIFCGNALLAFSVAAFILPHELPVGGTTGLGILLSAFLPIEEATAILLLNLLMLFCGLIALGKRFFFTTAAGSVLYPTLLAGFRRIPQIHALTDDDLLAALLAGAVLGAALGIVMRVGSSTGGIDVLNLMLHKWLRLPVSLFVCLTDAAVLTALAFVPDFADTFLSGAEKILLGLLLLAAETWVLDGIMRFGRSKRDSSKSAGNVPIP